MSWKQNREGITHDLIALPLAPGMHGLPSNVGWTGATRRVLDTRVTNRNEVEGKGR